VAITALFLTTTQPTGTSPEVPADSAAFSARSMKEGAFMARNPQPILLLDWSSAKVNPGFCVTCAAQSARIAL
jgi:hypothetical protein